MENGAVECLKNVEDGIARDEILSTNEDGVKFLRIPAVAKEFGIFLEESELLNCGKFVMVEYEKKYKKPANKIKALINNKQISIKHYEAGDFKLLLTSINKYVAIRLR